MKNYIYSYPQLIKNTCTIYTKIFDQLWLYHRIQKGDHVDPDRLEFDPDDSKVVDRYMHKYFDVKEHFETFYKAASQTKPGRACVLTVFFNHPSHDQYMIVGFRSIEEELKGELIFFSLTRKLPGKKLEELQDFLLENEKFGQYYLIEIYYIDYEQSEVAKIHNGFESNKEEVEEDEDGETDFKTNEER
jgi:hypothetical protein